MTLQPKVRALLFDYLTGDEEGVVSARNPIIPVNEVLRVGKFTRDHSKVCAILDARQHGHRVNGCRIGQAMFRFSDSDTDASSQLLKRHEEELNRSLKSSVPGLVNPTTEGPTSSMGPSHNPTVLSLVKEDKYSTASSTGTHKLLVSPDAFNVSILFAPTLAFLGRVQDVMPPGLVGDEDRGFGGFLDDFVLHTFLPQLEDKVATVFLQSVGGNDAFQEDPNYRRVLGLPIAKVMPRISLACCDHCPRC
jgi:exocyst complex component 4